ncbi:MAG: toll/interleukin-1 receptor domain-containing protein [Desulfobacula sp.]|nr:toll/interleukin-1 receptor domain-containing protein [Desulfobacula sp.]
MINDQEKRIPKVFISYSHDSAKHKKWVGELASRLVKNGIDVILDQWDLGLGDDIPKFMEKSVSVSDRVLMVCTETYVKKADEGTGGVGYEAMIVTGELVRNLGTSKFIPIVKQKGVERLLPKSVATRFYVDLSDEHNFDDQFEIFLRELHEAPSSVKPPLGKNPFAQKPSGGETSSASSNPEAIPDIISLSDDILSVYHTALDVARKGDLVAWRRIVKQAILPISDKLTMWRSKYEKNVPNDLESLHRMALEGTNAYAPLFSIALAGIESGRDKFSNQISLIDEILNPRAWNPGGITTIVYFPDAVACIYQALNGAMCLQTHQLSLSAKLARAKVTKRYEDKSLPLYQRHEIVGWPDTLGRKSTDVWSFLSSISRKWEWLNEPFGKFEEYRESLCAYYLVLNIIELVDTIAAGNESMLQENEIRLDVPLSFLHEDYEILRRAYRLLLVDPVQIRDIWVAKNIPENKIKELWPRWVYHITYWLSRSSSFFRFRTTIIHENLFNDLE